jgi:hypothetical protein
VRGAARWLLRVQNRDGGFGFSRSAASDVDDTGAALEAIAASGHRNSPVADRAVRYLRAAQRPDGGFAQMSNGDSNAQSSAWAVQGLVAVGRDPRKFRRARDPLAYLTSLQAGDGSVRYSRSSTQTPVWVTAQALAALEGKPFPLRPAARRKATAAASAPSTPAAAPASAKPAGPARSRKPRPRAHAAKAHPKPAAASASPQGSLTDEVGIRPAAATTTTASPARKPVDKPSRWPLYFMAGLGVAAILGLRLAWRRD